MYQFTILPISSPLRFDHGLVRMIRLPFGVPSVVIACVGLTAARGGVAQSTPQTHVLDGVVLQSLKNDQTNETGLVGVKNAIVVLCATASNDTTCSTVASIVSTEPNFTRFVKEVLAQHGIEHLHIIAHSMGNRILMNTLFVDKLTAAKQTHLGQIVFAAPDVDRSYFDSSVVVTKIKPVRVTLYASNHDQALALSKVANCGKTMFLNCVGRVGDARPNIEIKPGMDSVDASAVDTSLLGHSYIGASRSVLADFAEFDCG